MREKTEHVVRASHVRELLRSLGIDPNRATGKGVSKALAALGRRRKIIEQVRSQEKGIPAEYEFGAICWWLGRCLHLQFIDTRPELPYLNKGDIAYPDVFAVFQCGKTTFSCLIEVKVRNSRRLELSSRYVKRLKNYPLAAKYPLLIAWRYREFWTLFDIDAFKTQNGGVKVSFEDAFRASMMDIIVGNFTMRGFKVGVEWGFSMKPEGDMAPIRDGKVNTFRGRGVGFSVSDPSTGNTMEITNALILLLPFLGAWVPYNEYTDTLVITGERNGDELSLPAYKGLVFGTIFQMNIFGKRVDWKDMLSSGKFLFSLDDVYKVIHEGGKKGMWFEDLIITSIPSIRNPCLEPAIMDEFLK